MAQMPSPPIVTPQAAASGSALQSVKDWVTENKLAAASIVAGVGGLALYMAFSSGSKESEPASAPAKKIVEDVPKKEKVPVKEKEAAPAPVIPQKSTSTAKPDNENKTAQAMAMKEKGNGAFKQRQYKEALEYYTKAIEVYDTEDSTCAVFYNNRAACLSHIKPIENDKIIADTSAAIRLNPTYIKAYLKRASTYETMKENRMALRDYMAAVSIPIRSGNAKEPDPAAGLAMDRVLQTLGQEAAKTVIESREPLIPATSTLKPFFDGFCCKQAVTEPLSAEELNKEIEAAPSDGVLYYRRAMASLQAANYGDVFEYTEKAVQLLEEGGQDENALIDALSLKGTFQHLRGELAEAEKTFQEALQKNPNHCLTLVRKAIATLETPVVDKFKKSQDDLQQAANLEPNNPVVIYHQAQLLLLSQQFLSAADGFQKCIDLGHTGYTPWLQLAATKHRLQQTTSTMDMFEAVETKFPNEAMVAIYKGQILMNNGDTKAADECFDLAMQADPTNPLPYVNKGMLYVSSSNGRADTQVETVKKGIDMFEKAIEIEPLCDVAHSHLGQIAIQQYKFEKAIGHFDEVIRLVHSADEIAVACGLKEAAMAQKELKSKKL